MPGQHYHRRIYFQWARPMIRAYRCTWVPGTQPRRGYPIWYYQADFFRRLAVMFSKDGPEDVPGPLFDVQRRPKGWVLGLSLGRFWLGLILRGGPARSESPVDP